MQEDAEVGDNLASGKADMNLVYMDTLGADVDSTAHVGRQIVHVHTHRADGGMGAAGSAEVAVFARLTALEVKLTTAVRMAPVSASIYRAVEAHPVFLTALLMTKCPRIRLTRP
jgi:hypothetical protein